MSESGEQSTRVLELAEEFVQRHRAGDAPSIEEYIDRHPELADRIREVFPAMAMIEDVAVAAESLITGSGTGSPDGPALPTPVRLGDFRIIREVGRGGMGVVFEAEQISLGRHVALKVLPHQGAAGSVKLRRFLFEARRRGPAAPFQYRAGLRGGRTGRRALLRHAIHPGPGPGRRLRRAACTSRGDGHDEPLGGRQPDDRIVGRRP